MKGWAWALAIGIAKLFNRDFSWMVYIHFAFSPLQGLLNSIVYGINDDISGKLRAHFHQSLPNLEGKSVFKAKNENFLSTPTWKDRVEKIGYDWQEEYDGKPKSGEVDIIHDDIMNSESEDSASEVKTYFSLN